jgi:hypothetical protein
MEVLAASYWLGQNNTSCVDGLPAILKVDATGNFFDKHRR